MESARGSRWRDRARRWKEGPGRGEPRLREGMEVSLSHKMSLNATQLILESARVKDEATRPARLEESAPEVEETSNEADEEPEPEVEADTAADEEPARKKKSA